MTAALRSSATRLVGLAAAALVLAALVLPWRPPTLCLLRAATGVPCPFCGSTTAAVSLGRADLAAAWAASPLALVGGSTWVLWPLVRERLAAGRRVRWAVVAGAVLASWAYQLSRY